MRKAKLFILTFFLGFALIFIVTGMLLHERIYMAVNHTGQALRLSLETTAFKDSVIQVMPGDSVQFWSYKTLQSKQIQADSLIGRDVLSVRIMNDSASAVSCDWEYEDGGRKQFFILQMQGSNP